MLNHFSFEQIQSIQAAVLKTTKKAAQKVLQIHKKSFAIEWKADQTPLTEADLAVNTILQEELPQILDIPIVSEESPLVNYQDRQKWDFFWLIDPIDGTRGFIDGKGEWLINIALIQQDRVIAGWLALPQENTYYHGWVEQGAYKLDAQNHTTPLVRHSQNPEQLHKQKCRIFASIHHREAALDDYLKEYPNAELISAGASSKFARLAENRGELYPRITRLNEWDVAAGHGILKAAGGNVYKLGSKEEISYNTSDMRVNSFEAY
jgi:3'(2'), 5'-bisphosphate nucleotidase